LHYQKNKQTNKRKIFYYCKLLCTSPNI